MALHVHVPEGLNHFGKHLFATFLGLLMALGLESCHEGHRQSRQAKDALRAIRAELTRNLEECRKVHLANQARIEQLTRTHEAIRTLLATPGAKPTTKQMALDLGFQTPDCGASAWQAAASAQIIHRLPFDQVQALEFAYEAQRASDRWFLANAETYLREVVSVVELPAQRMSRPDERQEYRVISKAVATILSIQALSQSQLKTAVERTEQALARLPH